MFCPTRVVHNSRWLYICRHEGCDYSGPAPWRVRLNPLRLEIGIRINASSGPRWSFNRGGRLAITWSNLCWRLRGGDSLLKLKMLWLYRGSFRDWRHDVWMRDAGERMCCDGYMCGCYGSTYGSMWEHLWMHRHD